MIKLQLKIACDKASLPSYTYGHFTKHVKISTRRTSDLTDVTQLRVPLKAEYTIFRSLMLLPSASVCTTGYVH